METIHDKIIIRGTPKLEGSQPKAKTQDGRYFVCAMVKDEHDYIREWALYNRKLGFDKIVLYDDGSSMPYDSVIGDLMKEGFVEFRPWCDHRWSRQSRAYNEFVWGGSWGPEDYCAFIDPDEYICFDKVKTIAEFMALYHEYAGVGLSWKMYNANGRIKAPEGLTMAEAYTKECKGNEPCIKVVGRLTDIKEFPTAHHFIPKRGQLVTTCLTPVCGMYPLHRDYANGHIKHFVTRSWEDWVKRLKRGNITPGLRDVDTFFKFNPDMEPMRFDLTKDLDLDIFPTLYRDGRPWDGD